DDLVSLGEHRLKDLMRPEHLYQVGSETFPPLHTLNASTLPEVAHPLVGRRTEQAELTHFLRRERLVTITGAGGAGKTRLALQLAAELLDDFPDGVRFVSLASLSDPALVLPVAMEAFGLTEADDTSNLCALLVLDNFEHLIDAAPVLAAFLTRSSGPTLLVTSRMPLHVTMELEYPLDPLPEPAAVELFLDRARAIRREIEPSADVEEICRRLDGLPLALELAAARLRLLDPATLLKRLDSRLSLLTRGPRDLPERQQTLEATIAWSFELLDEDAQRLAARVSVFAGTFDLEAVERVVEADLDMLTTIVEASLVNSRGDGRFLMLETVREFARGRIDAEAALQLPARHAAHYLGLAESAEPHLTGRDAAAWLARIDADSANFRTALDWFALESPHDAVRLALALWRFWLVRGRYEEGETAITRALALEPPQEERAELLYRLGAIVISRGDTSGARELFQQALQEFRHEGVARGEARSLSALGHVAADAGNWPEAIRSYEEAAAMFRKADDRYGLGGVLGDLATVFLRSGAPEQAKPIAAESIELQRAVDNRQGEALALATHGYADLRIGNLGEAQRALTESTEIARDLGYMHGLLFSLNGLAAVAVQRGEQSRAATIFRAARALRRSLGIEQDPDDRLVADDRRVALLGDNADDPLGDTDFDVDAAVATALRFDAAPEPTERGG
ncbi:MAG TPA: tetratricopeptide repeat protein, partial [Gaiellaceae bacterium]|nr:tetratricopeptide repeat protein [Gaiellaceae bacterium]